jgi:predicted Rossmann fold flavoprotein
MTGPEDGLPTPPSSTDLAIVGAGAAGLACAIFAAQRANELSPGRPSPIRIHALDSADRPGAKILVSGGGRCNLTHATASESDYNGPPAVVRGVLRAFDVRHAAQWFESLGVPLKQEPTGKLFPVSDSARTVLDALLRRTHELGVSLRTGCRVASVRPNPAGGFILETARGDWQARRVVLATGGRSLPKTGSDGSGWALARSLGHSVTPTWPALAPLVLAEHDPSGRPSFHASLSGLSLDVELSTSTRGRLVDRRRGSLLFTHFGLTGPVVMDASRHWLALSLRGEPAELSACFVPGWDFDRAEAWWLDRASREPRRATHSVLAELLPPRLAQALVQAAGASPATPLGQLSREHRRSLSHALVRFTFPVLRDRGWNYAEVTAGGVPLAELDRRDLQSRICPGLHIIGEMLDCDGRIGGFNFQWAWSTAYLAGRAAAQALAQ